jgi:hypothetical protein
MMDRTTADEVLERRLRDWMSTGWVDSDDAPMLKAVAGQTRGLGQHHGVRARLQRLTWPTPRSWRSATRRPMRVVMAIILLLVTMAGTLLLISGTQPTGPVEPSMEMRIYPRLPDGLPTDRTGTFETAIGPARWVHLVGDLDSWPVDFRPLPGPTGLLALDLGGNHPECEVVLEETTLPDGTGFMRTEDCVSPPGLWRSPDGLTWVREPLPVANASWLDLAHETWWLRSDDDPTALRRSNDAVEWTEVDLSSLRPPAPANLPWTMELGRAVATGDDTVIPVLWTVRDTDRLLGLPDDSLGVLGPARDGRFTIRSLLDQGVLGSIEVAETVSGLRITDATDGRLISEIPDVDMTFMDRWVAHGGIVEQRLASIDGDLATPVSLPGAPLYLPEQGFDGLHLFGWSGGFRAFSRTADERLRVWYSADGRAWTEEDMVSVGDQTTFTEVEVRQKPGEDPLIIIYSHDGAWESPDGHDWQVAVVDERSGFAARWIADGLLSTGRIRNDDGSWQPLFDTSIVPAANVSDGDRIGDTWFANKVSRVDGAPRQDLWIVQIEMSPG